MLEETLKDRSYENKVDLYKREVSRLETEITSTQQSLLNEREYSYTGSKVNRSCKSDLSRAQADMCSLHQDPDHS